MNIDFSKLKGQVIIKGDSNYEEEIKGWNRGVEKYPSAIIFCKDEEEVIETILFAKNENIPFRIRSGRHHYEGFSSGDDILVLDISRMNEIYVDEDNSIVKIQGGVRNRELYEAVCKRGYAFPGGGCPTVGVVGFTLGGGWGYSSRLLGLGIDSLLEVELINHSGEKIIANKNHNSDLFWALKGCGGGNFGVVTSMKFKLDKKIPHATVININYKNLTIEEKVKIIQVWQQEFKNIDNRLNLKTVIYNSKINGTGVKSTGLFYGTEEEARNVLQAFTNINIGSENEFNFEYTTVLDANRKIQDSHPDYERYKSTGRFVYRSYNEKELLEIVNIVSQLPESADYIAVSFYGLGGVVKDVPKESSSFYYRDAKAIMGFQIVWENQKNAVCNKKWMIEKFDIIKKMTLGSFINFPLKELADYENEYYGEFKEKLKDINHKYDPNNVFNFEQSITLKNK